MATPARAAPPYLEEAQARLQSGDDADTTVAIFGQLAGASWGESNMPEPLRSGLVRMDVIEEALAGALGA